LLATCLACGTPPAGAQTPAITPDANPQGAPAVPGTPQASSQPLAVPSDASQARRQTSAITPTIAAELTFTNNVDLAPSGQRVSDWVLQLTPGVAINERGAHSRLEGNIAIPVLLYARTSENNYVAPDVNLRGTFEAVERFLFIDATVNVSQQFQNALGPQPQNLANATDNRYTAQSYTISPYIKGDAPNRIDYELRQSSIWSNANVTTFSGSSRSFTNDVTGHVAQAPAPVGWSLEYSRSDVKFEQQQSETMEISRLRGVYQPDPTWQVLAIAGYEDNRFIASREHGPVYGIGGLWRPTDRTRMDGTWEHRFFGSSYHVTFDHRTPLTVWSFRASRDISTYPQQLAALAAGSNVSTLLNNLFLSRIQDPLQRGALVDQFIRERGLPSELTSPLTLYSQRVTLLESETATAGLIGARNSVFFTAYRSRDEPLETFEGVSFNTFAPTTQVGANIVWNHRATANANLETSIAWWRTREETLEHATSNQYWVQSILSVPLTVLTSVHAGARYQYFRADTGNVNEFAVFVGINHLFH